MLLWRIAVAAILIPLLVGIFWLDACAGPTAPILLLFVVALAWSGAGEMCDLLQTRNFTPQRGAVVACTIFVAISGWYGRVAWSPIKVAPDQNTLAQVMLAYSISLLVLFFLAAHRYREPGQTMETLAAELLIVSYIGVLLGVASQLRWVAGADAGYFVIGSMVVVVKGGDVGAFALGSMLGGSKMAPLLSPGKTWSGACGAILGSAAGAVLWFRFMPGWFDRDWTSPFWPFPLIYGMVLGVVGLIGDLCESMIKRDVGKKDSSTAFPGFGGLLDLLDSVIYAGPVAYVLWRAMPLATWKTPE